MSGFIDKQKGQNIILVELKTHATVLPWLFSLNCILIFWLGNNCQCAQESSVQVFLSVACFDALLKAFIKTLGVSIVYIIALGGIILPLFSVRTKDIRKVCSSQETPHFWELFYCGTKCYLIPIRVSYLIPTSLISSKILTNVFELKCINFDWLATRPVSYTHLIVVYFLFM